MDGGMMVFRCFSGFMSAQKSLPRTRFSQEFAGFPIMVSCEMCLSKSGWTVTWKIWGEHICKHHRHTIIQIQTMCRHSFWDFLWFDECQVAVLGWPKWPRRPDMEKTENVDGYWVTVWPKKTMIGIFMVIIYIWSWYFDGNLVRGNIHDIRWTTGKKELVKYQHLSICPVGGFISKWKG